MDTIISKPTALVLLALLLPSFAAASERKEITREDGASVPMMVYRNAGANCSALALISPGAGGTENTMAYLAEALSQQGWTAVVIGHRESGPDVVRSNTREAGLRQGLLDLTTNASAYRHRFMDIAAVLQWAAEPCRRPFVALIGHSMGAATVMLEAGAKNRLGLQGRDRFDAYVAMSPQGPGSIFPAGAWNGIRKPVLVLTGTRDNALEGDWQTRTAPYADMNGSCKWLGIIDGASHMNFAGIGFAGATKRLTVSVTSSFLNSARDGMCRPPAPESGITLQSK